MIIRANPFVRTFGDSLLGMLWFSTYSSCAGRRMLTMFSAALLIQRGEVVEIIF